MFDPWINIDTSTTGVFVPPCNCKSTAENYKVIAPCIPVNLTYQALPSYYEPSSVTSILSLNCNSVTNCFFKLLVLIS